MLPLSLLLKVFGQRHLFEAIVSALTLRDLANLKLALPQLDPFWIRALFPRIVHRHAKHRDVYFYKEKVDFYDYVRICHMHQHSAMEDRSWMRQAFITDIYDTIPIRSLQTQLLNIQYCLFMPSNAPGIFANNLAVLCNNGRKLVLFAPQVYSFKITATFDLGCHCHSLAVSPRGSMILVANIDTVLVTLRQDGQGSIFGTTVAIAKKTFQPDCFLSETSFLSVDENFSIRVHHISIEEGITVLHRQTFFHAGDYGGNWTPFKHMSTIAYAVFWFKRDTSNSPECLIIAEQEKFRGLGNRIRLIGSPRGSMRSIYIQLPACLIASIVIHPSQDVAYIIVVTHIDREKFMYNSDYRPIQTEEKEHRGWIEPEYFDDRVVGYVGVYELDFTREEICFPKYYLEGLTTDSHLQETDYHRLHDKGDHMRIQAKCNYRDLHIKLNCDHHALIPLCTTVRSKICYHFKSTTDSNCWAVSENSTFAAYFARTCELFREPLNGYRICDDYDECINGDTVKMQPINWIPNHFDRVMYI